MRLAFVYLPLAEKVLTDDEWRIVERQLLENPKAGDVIAGTGGVRKLRVAFEHRGKSGSARTIYLHVDARQRVYFLLAYAKNDQEDMSAAEKKQIRALVEHLKRFG